MLFVFDDDFVGIEYKRHINELKKQKLIRIPPNKLYKFKEIFAKTEHESILRRIEGTKSLLWITVSDLQKKNTKGMESGFQSVISFNKCFKAHFKMLPTEYKGVSFVINLRHYPGNRINPNVKTDQNKTLLSALMLVV